MWQETGQKVSACGEIESPGVEGLTPVSCYWDIGQCECPDPSGIILRNLIFQALRLGMGDNIEAARLQGTWGNLPRKTVHLNMICETVWG